MPPKTNYTQFEVNQVSYILTTRCLYVPANRLTHIHMHNFQLLGRLGVQRHGIWLPLPEEIYGNQMMGYLSFADYIWFNHPQYNNTGGNMAIDREFDFAVGTTSDPANRNRTEFLDTVRLVVGPRIVMNNRYVNELITIFPK